MSVVYVLVILAVLLVTAAVLAFVWAVRRDQFEDLETPALRMLFDSEATAADPPPSIPSPEGPEHEDLEHKGREAPG